MKRFMIALTAVLLLTGPVLAQAAFAQADQSAQGTEGKTEKKAQNEPHKKKMHKKMAHKKTNSNAAPAAGAAPAPAAGGTQN